ncbi:type III secretion system effector protein [Xanthomonas hyacinthi]|uniref:Type III secretion system effector protein n=1 Tax=Xanthomonas hyacinthi TaxID=56455 RepID=A0A2S7EV20_9XANT|nr:type III secretion system effector protein [Xanthomonas hyacinthi]QGY78057.1 type III secretion system effector protein [Xanthomonas hyacinthi]
MAEHLRRYDAVADATDATESQAQLEQEYIGWAAERLQQRREAFGPNGGYRFNVDMKAAGTDASLPTAYRALKGFLASALRMPFGNAAATQLDKKDGELTPKFCPTVAGGAAAGLGSAFTEQILLSAIERRARLANMPAFRPVPPAILSPEPGPVRMEITPEGTKRFWRPPHADQLSQLGNHDDRPTFEVLQCDAQDRQRQLLQRQKLLEGHAEATFLRPLLSGGFSGIRRGLSPASVLLSPIKVLGTSMLSSGTGGALTNAILETGKALPWTGQARVDNLVGGSQTVNLFRLARPDESMEPLRWGDIRRLHNTLLDIVQEAGALAAQPLTSPRMAMRTARDLLLHHIGGNIFSSWVATGGGTLLASLVRGGYGAPPADEMLSSPGSVVQQSGQAFSDNTVWPALNSTLGDTSQNLAASLDRRRDSEQARLWSKAATMRNQLLAQIDTVRRNADGAQDQRLHELAGTLSQSLEHRGGAADLDAALGAIDRVLGEPGGATEATLERLRVLKDTVAQQRAVLVRSQALREWRSGRRQTSA